MSSATSAGVKKASRALRGSVVSGGVESRVGTLGINPSSGLPSCRMGPETPRELAERTAAAVRDAVAPVVPRWRGKLHAWAFWFALVAAVTLVVVAPGGRPRAAAAIYGGGLCALFAVSGLYHRWRWDPRWKGVLRRLDHSTIFVFIAASYTPVALLVLTGSMRWVVLGSVWTGAAAGVALSVGWIDAPRTLTAACYIAVGWVAVIAMPQLLDRVGVGTVVLFATGGILYSLGAVTYATQRPNPWPRTFGFHEVFHTLVIVAAVVHFVAIAGVIDRTAT
jgi:hemolysin III